MNIRYVHKFLAGVLFYYLIPVPALAQQKESVLWEISGKDLAKRSYLFGTDHCTPYAMLDSFPQVKKIIDGCTYGLFEKGGEGIGEIKDTILYTPPLDSVFTKEEYAIVDSFFINSPYGSIKPHNNDASLQGMAQAVVMLRQSPKQEMFFDEYIHVYMIDSLHRRTFQLDEPVQMAREETPPARRLAEAILFLIKDTALNKTVYADTAYFDIQTYHSSLMQDMKLQNTSPEWMGKGVTERNLLWIPKILKLAHEQSCFIAVGLGHLEYKNGLIRLLRQQGYTVRPVELKKIGKPRSD